MSTEEFPGFEQVASFGYWDYEWSEMRVYREARSGRLFGLTDSGCSCFGWGDGWRNNPDKGIAAMTELPSLKAGVAMYEDLYRADEATKVVDVTEKLVGLGLR